MISKVDKPIFDREKEVIKPMGIVSNELLCFGFVQKEFEIEPVMLVYSGSVSGCQ